MKKSVFASFLFLILFLSSCGETTVIETVPNIGENAAPISGYFKKRVLIEDYTGTWCGNCTRVALAIDQVKEQTDKTVTVGIHYAPNNNDPYHFAGIAPLKNLILGDRPLGLPVSRINRMTPWTFPESSNLAEVLNLTGNNTGVGLAMNSSINNGMITIDVNVKYALNNYRDLKLVVYLLEDNLIYRQTNYTAEYYGGANPIPNFVHNHVLRDCMTESILGDPINSTVSVGEVVTKSFSKAIPESIENPENLNFVAFLVGVDNKAINARASHINENQDFEENP